jgi:hypothetical protein
MAATKITAQAVKKLLQDCVGFDGDELQTSRTEAYNYYFQRARGDEVAGRSQFVSGDLSSMIEGNLAQMVEPLSGKRIAEYCAYDALDKEQAAKESDCVYEMLFKRQNGFIEITSAIKDAMLVRTSIVKVHIERLTHKSTVKRSNVDPAIVYELLDKIGKVDVHKYDGDTGTLSATVTKETRQFKCESIAPENFLIPKNWHKQDLKDIPFCAERHVETRAKLIERGFDKDKVARIRRYNNFTNAGSDARLPRNISPTSNPLDKSQDLVEWYECYVMMDDGTGAATLHCISTSDRDILEDEEDVTIIPYALGVVILNPHTFMGISLHDKLKSTQDGSTALTRALFDNLNATNKNRTAHLDGVADEDDITDGRTNGSIRVKPGVVPDVRMAVAAFAVPDTSANILQNLQYMKQNRSEMGGAALDMATGQMQLNDRLGSQGLDRAYSVMEQNAAFMTRIIANTLVRGMYLIAHEVLRTEWDQPISFERGKDWIQQLPSKWQTRESVSLNLGASMNERARQSVVLEKVMEKQAALADHGMEDILVDVTSYYNASMDWLRINDVPTPERYFIDPRTPKAMQAMQQRAISSKQQQQQQQALMFQAVGLEQMRVGLQKYLGDARLQFDYYNAVLNAQVEEAKITASSVMDYMKAKVTAVGAFISGKGKPNEPPDDNSRTKEAGRIEPESESPTDGDTGGVEK